MAETILCGVTIQPDGTERDAWTVHVNATDPANDGWGVTVDGDDDAIAAASSRSRVDRWRVQVDLGAGLEYVDPDEVKVIAITGSLDEWADRCALEFYGARWSPSQLGIMRGLVPVVVEETIGEASAPITRTQFRGVIVSTIWDAANRVARCEALDDAGKASETTIAPYLQPNSGVTRDGYAVGLIEAAGLTLGRVDSGVNGVKVITKPVSKVDVLLWDYLRDWYSPCGAWIYTVDGRVNVEKWSDTRPVAAELWPHDCVSVPELTPPASLAPNKITCVSVKYETLSTSGVESRHYTETTYETYAIKGAVAKQDKTTGAIVTVSYGDASAQYRKVREVRTTQSFRGDVLIYSYVEEWGYGADRTARLELDSDLVTVNHLGDYDCYQYDDGNWYKDKRETWRRLSWTVAQKTVDTNNRATEAIESRYAKQFFESPIGQLAGSPPLPDDNAALGYPHAILEDGRGVNPPYEYMATGSVVDGGGGTIGTFYSPAERTVRTFTFDTGGYLIREEEIAYRYSFGARASSQRAGSWVQGIDEGSRTYWESRFWELRESSSRKITYSEIDNDNYLSTEELRDYETNKRTTFPAQQGRGPRPRPEEILPKTRSQELRRSVTDEVREFLAGKTIEEWIQNEYAQDDNDLLSLATARIQDESAWSGSVVVPHSHVIRKGHYINLRGFAAWGLPSDSVRCLVRGVAIDPQAKLKTLTLRYLPPEVDRV